MTKFTQLIPYPSVTVNDELHQLTGLEKGKEINFWEELISYVVPDASVREMTTGLLSGMVILRHHSFGDCKFEFYKDGSVRGTVNAKRLIEFFKAAKVEFE